MDSPEHNEEVSSDKQPSSTEATSDDGKTQSQKNESRKRKHSAASKFFESEAEESDTESGAKEHSLAKKQKNGPGEDDDDDDDDDEEDDSNYVADDFLVVDGENSDADSNDDEDGDGNGDGNGTSRKQLTRLKKRRGDVHLDEEDVLLIQEHQRKEMQLQIEQKRRTGNENGAKAEDATEDGERRKGLLDGSSPDVDGSEDADDDAEIAPMRGAHQEEEGEREGEEEGTPAARRTLGRYGAGAGDEDSDLGDFIVHDEVEGEDAGEGEGDGEGKYGDDASGGHRRSGTAPVSEGSRFRRAGSRGGGGGPTFDQVQDALDIFGEDFDDFDDEELDDGLGPAPGTLGSRYGAEGSDDARGSGEGGSGVDAEELRSIRALRARFEPSQLVASFCTEADEELRRTDRPERLQQVLRGREVPDDAERAAEAAWIASKIAPSLMSAQEREKLRGGGGAHVQSAAQNQLAEELTPAVEAVLRFLQVDQLEVPFIWTYRRDYLHPRILYGVAANTRAAAASNGVGVGGGHEGESWGTEEGEGQGDTWQRGAGPQHLWAIHSLDEQWEALYSAKLRLIEEIQALSDAASAAEGAQAQAADELAQERLQQQVANVERDFVALHAEVQAAEQEQQQAMDAVEALEEADAGVEQTAGAREAVRRAGERLAELREQEQEQGEELRRLQLEEAQQGQRLRKRAQFSPAKAREVMRLFPTSQYLPLIELCREELELRDLVRFVRLLAQGAEAQGQGAEGQGAEGQGAEGQGTEGQGAEATLSASHGSNLAATSQDGVRKGVKGGDVAGEEEEEEEFGSDMGGSEATAATAERTQSPSEPPVAAVADVAQAGAVAPTRQIRRLKDEYARCRAVPSIRQFAEMLALPICDFAESLRCGAKVEPPAPPSAPSSEVAARFAQEHGLRSAETVLHAASVVVASELAAEPTVRRLVREVFRRTATLSTRPTQKGLTAITPFSELFGLHMLDRKPLTDLLDAPSLSADAVLFARLLDAEKQGLLTVTIDPPTCRELDAEQRETGREIRDVQVFLYKEVPLMPHFLPSVSAEEDPHPEARLTWDAARMAVMELCIEQLLLPAMQREFRQTLARAARESIVEQAAHNFRRALQVGPYRPPRQDSREQIRELLSSCPRRPFYATVAAIYLSSGRREPMCMACVNRDGILRAHDLVPAEAAAQKKQRLVQFLLDCQPDLIVLNASGGAASRSTAALLEKEVLPHVAQKLLEADREQREQRLQSAYGGAYGDDELDAETPPYAPQVLIIDDEVAVIFKNSPRAKKMYPELQPAEAAAVSLARFTQEPLAEYAAMWQSANSRDVFGHEILFLDLHPCKSLLRGSPLLLLRSLERCLVDAVCAVGVDVNKACALDHWAPLLAFVGGLGLRKAHALRQSVRKMVGVVDSRNALLVRRLLGSVVYTNAVGFLRITPDFGGSQRMLDPFDNTRIHPECYVTYDFAPKICADALESECQYGEAGYVEDVARLMDTVRRDLKKRMKRHPRWLDLWERGRPVPGLTRYDEVVRTADGKEHSLGVELSDCLAQLLLEDYVAELEQQGLGRRRLQFEDLKEELRYPWLDLRPSITAVSEDKFFSILSGESSQSLYVGLKVSGTVTDILEFTVTDARTMEPRRRQRAVVQTDTGLRGSISDMDVLDRGPNGELAAEELDGLRLEDYLQRGMRLQAVVVGVRKDRLQLDLSVKPSLVGRSEAWWMEHRSRESRARQWWRQRGIDDPQSLFDRHFLEREALAQFEEAERAQQQQGADRLLAQVGTASLAAEGGAHAHGPGGDGGGGGAGGSNRSLMRVVHHPLFANLDFKAAETRLRLEGKGAGEVLVRPSSKGADYLTITWAFQDGWFKHISVREEGRQKGELGLGTRLVVQEEDLEGEEPYRDLDEIFARYIEPMNDLVAAMVKDRRFLPGSVAEVEQAMQQQREQNPKRIPYFFRFEPDKPGSFALTWQEMNAAGSTRAKSLRIEVRPHGYRVMRNLSFSRPSEVVDWFKRTMEAKQLSASTVPTTFTHTPSSSAGDKTAKPTASARAAAAAAAATQQQQQGGRRSRWEKSAADSVTSEARQQPGVPQSLPMLAGSTAPYGLGPAGGSLGGTVGASMHAYPHAGFQQRGAGAGAGAGDAYGRSLPNASMQVPAPAPPMPPSRAQLNHR